MHILCLLIVPLFFVAITLYFQTWMEVDDFNAVFKFFFWGIAFGVAYQIGLFWLNAPFYNKIALPTLLIKFFCIDGLTFSALFVLTFFGLCKLYEIDSANLWAKSAVVCFGYICGILTIANIVTFFKAEYTNRWSTYIPYLLCYLSVCASIGFCNSKVKELSSWWAKLLFMLLAIVIVAIFIGSFNFLMQLGDFKIYLPCVIYCGVLLALYILDYRQYGE